MEIGKRCGFIKTNVSSTPHLSCGTSGDDGGQVHVIVNIGVADAGAVKVKRMVEERAVAFFGGLQLLQEFGEKGNVEGVDLRHPLDLVGIVAVVRKGMVRIGNSDFRVGAIAGFPGKLEGDDTSHVCL